ncbi:SAM-dependent methyltransferase [Psychrobacter aestuarii]|uniref:Cyclopropane-fatty-acyl-phospholipid synthase family protein n=1 Tax=Psychrobacter aestuarii TaxID=556327 RepID=A0ABN0VN74_9GAMM|nr:cyclopropane-fatty-acyl-phospholipid synthase family protein [Psychrobacter aestuarii]
MPTRPTDRTPSSTFEKATARISQTVNNTAVLKPLSHGVNYAAKQVVFRALKNIRFGSITIIEDFKTDNADERSIKANQTHHFGSATTEGHQTKGSNKHSTTPSSSEAGHHRLDVTLTIHDDDVYRQLLFGGSIALADSYIDGKWDTDDLTGFIRLAARNLSVINDLEARFAGITKTFEKAKHQLRSNDKSNAKSNILAHYDLGNAMYQTFLDPTMMYSSAVYPSLDSTLAEAQQHKLALICERLQLTADDEVLEIGTGWGGFAIYAATHYGCHVTTTTISDAQYQEAMRRVEAAGLSDKITLLQEDYRELTGTYDKLVSIEMIEAVGHEYLPTFFAKCNALLKPTGLMVLQAITFNDQNYERYLQSVDFIQTHIFPGGCLLSNQALTTQFTEQTDMVIKQLHDYGYDYAYTLRDWRAAFMDKRDEIIALGYDEAFIRLWEFYFCYCEGGFLERTIGVVQVTAVKPKNTDTWLGMGS